MLEHGVVVSKKPSFMIERKALPLILNVPGYGVGDIRHL
jgi:hypothetical protein